MGSRGYGSHTDGHAKVSFDFQSCLLASTALNWSFISLEELHQSVRKYCSQKNLNCSLSAKYEHVQNRSNLFEHEEKLFLTYSN